MPLEYNGKLQSLLQTGPKYINVICHRGDDKAWVNDYHGRKRGYRSIVTTVTHMFINL